MGEDAAAVREMIDITDQRGVPVIILDGEAIVGSDRLRNEARFNIDKGKEISADHELIIIGLVGSGAAGLAGRKGLETLVIDGARGGMATRTYEIENLSGLLSDIRHVYDASVCGSGRRGGVRQNTETQWSCSGMVFPSV